MKIRTDFVTNSSSTSFIKIDVGMLDGSALRLDQVSWESGGSVELRRGLDVALAAASTGEEVSEALFKAVDAFGVFDNISINGEYFRDERGLSLSIENELFGKYLSMVKEIPSLDLVREISVRCSMEYDGNDRWGSGVKIDYDVVRGDGKAVFAVTGPAQVFDARALAAACEEAARDCPGLSWEESRGGFVVAPFEESDFGVVLQAVDRVVASCRDIELTGLAGLCTERKRRTHPGIEKYVEQQRYDFWSPVGVDGVAWRKRVTVEGKDEMSYGLSAAFVDDVEGRTDALFKDSLVRAKTKGRRIRKGVELVEGDTVILKNKPGAFLREYSNGELTGEKPLRVTVGSLGKKALGELDVDPVVERLISLNIGNCIAFVASVDPLELWIDLLPDRGVVGAEAMAEMLLRGAKTKTNDSSKRYKSLKGYLRKFPQRKEALGN